MAHSIIRLASSSSARRFATLSIAETTAANVVPTYARYPMTLTHGDGAFVWDEGGRRLLDLGGGIAVNSLGHAHPEVSAALLEQSQKLVHTSNLYFTQPQADLAASLVRLIGPGKVFFCNSGAEANEGMFKFARLHGIAGQAEEEAAAAPRMNVITMIDSFHGRTLGGVAATGQDKIKAGFGPPIDGFTHVPYNDLAAVEAAIDERTSAIMIEGIQGESGVRPATAEYLLGLRRLCDERGLLLLFDAVQCGHFRSGSFQSYTKILEGHPDPAAATFRPDGISMAKAMGAGVPIGAFWLDERVADMLSAGRHGTTFGGNPLACAVANRVLDVIERDDLVANINDVGEHFVSSLRAIQTEFPNVLCDVRGHGLMLGVEVAAGAPGVPADAASAAGHFVGMLHERGVMTVPAGTHTVRLLPPYNLTIAEADEGIAAIRSVAEELSN